VLKVGDGSELAGLVSFLPRAKRGDRGAVEGAERDVH